MKLTLNGTWKTSGPDGENKPIVQKVKIDFPKGSLYLGGSYKAKCTLKELSRAKLDNNDKLTGKCAKAVVGAGDGGASGGHRRVEAVALQPVEHAGRVTVAV